MGDILQATCGCGFESDPLHVGIGMGMVYFAPAVCAKCASISAVEYYADDSDEVRDHACERCGTRLEYLNEAGQFSPADFPKQYPDEQPWDLADRALMRYTCPKCRAMTLKFEERGLWD